MSFISVVIFENCVSKVRTEANQILVPDNEKMLSFIQESLTKLDILLLFTFLNKASELAFDVTDDALRDPI